MRKNTIAVFFVGALAVFGGAWIWQTNQTQGGTVYYLALAAQYALPWLIALAGLAVAASVVALVVIFAKSRSARRIKAAQEQAGDIVWEAREQAHVIKAEAEIEQKKAADLQAELKIYRAQVEEKYNRKREEDRRHLANAEATITRQRETITRLKSHLDRKTESMDWPEGRKKRVRKKIARIIEEGTSER